MFFFGKRNVSPFLESWSYVLNEKENLIMILPERGLIGYLYTLDTFERIEFGRTEMLVSSDSEFLTEGIKQVYKANDEVGCHEVLAYSELWEKAILKSRDDV